MKTIFILKSFCRTLLVVFLLQLLFFICLSQNSFSKTDSPRLLVHLLNYLSQDYPLTVSQGTVINPSEYHEQIEFSELTLKTYQEVEKKPPSDEVQKKLKQLHQLILQKKDGKQVSSLAREIQKELILFYQLEISPSQSPDLTKGQKIYSENCTSCHGTQGDGNGPLSNQLKPKPSNFLDPTKMKGLSPFQVFNTIRMGVPETAMVGFQNFSDQEVWNLAFYILSLRYQSMPNEEIRNTPQNLSLSMIASSSDDELLQKLVGTPEEKEKTLRAIRLQLKDNSSSTLSSLSAARTHLQNSLKAYQEKQFKLAEQESTLAYLEGIEPIESSLKVKDSSLVTNLEQKMGELRGFIKDKMSSTQIEQSIRNLETIIDKAELTLNQKKSSPWFIFLMTNSILLREGFEAILVIIAILGIIRVSNNRSAALWVHAGWGSAVLLGLITWFFSGWVIQMSGMARELMEGITSLLAVIILLYVGLWLHHKTEITRWTSFIDGKVKTALESNKLWGLSFIAFMAVFREAFETVLFLRSLALEGGEGSSSPLLGGVIVAFILVFLLAFALLKLSAKIPLKKLFNLSSLVIVALSVMLIGKGIKSFQEAGVVSISPLPISFRIDLLGLYPTLETLLPQGLVLIFILIVWNHKSKISRKTKN